MRIFWTFLLLTLAACTGGDGDVDERDLAAAEDISGVAMTPGERELMLEDVREHRRAFDRLHALDFPNALAPALVFDPGFERPPAQSPKWRLATATRPAQDKDLAFLSVAELGALLRSGTITSELLTRLYLDRIRHFDGQLHAMITVTEDRALSQARRADAELAAGIDRGPLHGIPYGLKDIAAVEGYPTTWGATPYKEQVIEETATVAKRMADAGAVLLGKTSVGALAWGDVWFDARTNSPWDLETGASGSSAGSAAGVAAGYFPVAIGTETWGSIISPSLRNGVIGLRPTFGRVSRAGFMTLSWSMDKVGAICRYAEDCGVVLDAIRGADPADPTSVDAGFRYAPGSNITMLRIGYLADDFTAEDYPQRARDLAVLERITAAGIALEAVRLPEMPVGEAMSFIISVEAAAAFDALTRSGRDNELVRQQRNAWPNVFRAARFVPAVEYLQANRVRTRLIDVIQQLFEQRELDVIIAPCFSGDQLLATNLSGHPSMVFPTGLDEDGMPTGICLIGRPFQEGDLLLLTRALQSLLDEPVRIPPLVQ